jgi:citrate synthase
MSKAGLHTKIGSSPADISRLKMRGANVLDEIVGHKSFAETFYFIVTGRWPTECEHKIFDAALVVLMDHGLTQSAVVARLVADSTPNDIQVGMAAGMLMVGDKFAGTMAGMGALLIEGNESGGDKRAWAADTVKSFRDRGARMPGFGHPYYKDEDPRATVLRQLALDAGVDGPFLSLLELLSEETDRLAGKHIVVNATAVLGAMLAEIGFPVPVMRAVAAVSRAAGLAAHIHEERSAPVTASLIDYVNAIEYVD